MKNKNTTSWGPEIWKPTPVSIKYQEPNLAYLKDYITTDIEESWIVNAKNKESDDLEFQGWFNGAESLEEIVSNGFIDFSHKIFTQDLYQYLGNPREKTSLEIGFGGGRLMNAAGRYFQKVIGIDIHDSFDKTSKFLEDSGCKNYELIHRDESSSIADETVDFIYSFIVFQHFKDWKEAENYFTLFKRVMKPGAIARIYFKTLPSRIPTPEGQSTETWGESECYPIPTPSGYIFYHIAPKETIDILQIKDIYDDLDDPSGTTTFTDARPNDPHPGKHLPPGIGSFSSLFINPAIATKAIQEQFTILEGPLFFPKTLWSRQISNQFCITFMKE